MIDPGLKQNYVLNKRTMKIHLPGCSYVYTMSERNRIDVNDTLSNLTNNKYVLCKKCGYGNDKKFSFFDDLRTLYEAIEKNLPSFNGFLDGIDTMGEWYIHNIPTYRKVIDISALDSAKDNYNCNYSKFTKTKHLLYYPCSLINHSTGNYKKAGDDCVRFLFSSINISNSKFTYSLSRILETRLSLIGTNTFLYDSDKLLYAMHINGFEIYDQNIDRYGILNKYVKRIDSNFNLQNGDIIVRKNHVHIFLDDKLTYADNFGWGEVKNIYPQKSNYSIKVDLSGKRYITSDRDIDASGNDLKYIRVFRYVGG